MINKSKKKLLSVLYQKVIHSNYKINRRLNLYNNKHPKLTIHS